MPTQHVEPETDEHLRDVANALLKAKKVVVITGAGISTNSGIPVRPAPFILPKSVHTVFATGKRTQ